LLLESVQDKNSVDIYDTLYSQQFSNEDAKKIGIQMRNFHLDISKARERIRSKRKDLEMYNNYLYWRFGIWNNKNLNIIIDELKGGKRQFIYGDFNPKNMVLTNGKLRIFDLETIHKGNVLFDIGFFAGHILLNFLNKPTRRIKLIESFFQGYGLSEDNLKMAIKLALATLYYRLKSNYSYGVNFSYNKNSIFKKIDDVFVRSVCSITLSDLGTL
jgi:hypothetical protein